MNFRVRKLDELSTDKTDVYHLEVASFSYNEAKQAPIEIINLLDAAKADDRRVGIISGDWKDLNPILSSKQVVDPYLNMYGHPALAFIAAYSTNKNPHFGLLTMNAKAKMGNKPCRDTTSFEKAAELARQYVAQMS